MLSLFKSRMRAWIAGLASGVFPAAPAGAECETGVLARYDPMADNIGDEINFPRWRGENCRSYRLRMQVFLQEEVLLRERYDALLTRLLDAERR